VDHHGRAVAFLTDRITVSDLFRLRTHGLDVHRGTVALDQRVDAPIEALPLCRQFGVPGRIEEIIEIPPTVSVSRHLP
jgi:hypothetical protein